MGAVIKGRDDELGRDLAVKVLLERYRDRPELIRRFIEEAQIAGQLQHPGIVPVYELGAFADNRPYFAMKLVRGQTLAELLAARVAPSQELPRFLAIFETICQTMAYAHARGVIHRDLKPANIMVGSFGEVQVMDWGLAKVLPRHGEGSESSQGSEADEDVIRTARSGSDVGESHAGSILGTPAYMAPEQARGEVKVVNERADVFGLGSILCEILTGHPAFSGRSGADSLRKAAEADLAEAFDRLDACQVDVGLLSLARACLAAEPTDRPRDAREVSSRMTAYLAGVQERLRQAELERVEAQARAAEERKRRRVEVGLVAAVLALVVLGSCGWFAFDRIERGRRNRTATEVQSALDVAHRLEGESRNGTDLAPWAEAVSAAERAQSLLRAGGDDPVLRFRVTTTLARLRAGQLEARERAEARSRDAIMVKSLEEALLKMADLNGEKLDHGAMVAAYRSAFQTYGVDVERLTEDEALAKLKTVAIREPIAAALDIWSWPAERALGARFARLANAIDPDPTRSAVRAAAARRDLKALQDLANREDAATLPAATLMRLGYSLRLLGSPAEAVAFLARGRARHADDFWINFYLAHSLYTSTPPRMEEAVRFYTAAAALRPDSPAVHTNLGNAFEALGRHDEAIEEQRRANELTPNTAVILSNLGMALGSRGRHEEAIAEYRRAITLRPDYALAHYNLGRALYFADRNAEAAVAYRRVIELQPDLAEAHCNLAWALRELGQFAESLVEMERGHTLGSKRSDWKYPSADWLLESQRLAKLEVDLSAVMKGGALPDGFVERMALINIASRKGLHAVATRHWQELSERFPGWADIARNDHRYWAARDAALASSDKAKDDPPPDPAARTLYRKQALGWLEADLTEWGRVLGCGTKEETASQIAKLKVLQTDPALACVRDEASLAGLPEDERRACRAFWVKLDTLLRSVTEPKP
jgi:serine/threonine-protein kinase